MLPASFRKFCALVCLVFAIFALEAGLLFAAETTAPEVGVTDGEILFGSPCDLSGPQSPLCKQQLLGAEAYFHSVNDSGGIEGRRIKLNRYDDHYQPANASSTFQRLVNDHCFAATCFLGSSMAEFYVPLIEKYKIPSVGFFTGADFLETPIHPHIFSVRASYAEEMKAQIDRIWRDLGPQRVAIIWPTIFGGSPIRRGTIAALKAHGAQPVIESTFVMNSLDYDQAITKAREAHPDLVVLAGPWKDLSEIVKKSHKQGWYPLFMTASLVGTEEFVSAAGQDAEGVLISQVLPPYNRQDLPTVAAYLRDIRKYYPDEKPALTSFEGYVDAMVIVEALRRAGKDLTRAHFITALESIKHKDLGLGPNMFLTYSPTRHQGLDSVYTTQVRNGVAVAYFNAKQLKREK